MAGSLNTGKMTRIHQAEIIQRDNGIGLRGFQMAPKGVVLALRQQAFARIDDQQNARNRREQLFC